ncbi:MAG: TIM barrel protein [Candidatus Aenigmarchaeota archaeon]|nr:TIM barrel protein [Candidatus Aenigmarchaeota archaeon]MCX8190606.1 TIM barrel protein [Candidatus Aenigmarchaeota archaeon]MDW8160149.1 TIM barrel protein [Candidatus Aenigmarchaeota archaeon]
MRIFLGPGGNCLTAKESSTESSFERLVELGLNTQEIEFVRNIYLTEKSAEKVGELAKKYKIKLSVHAPYFINLLSSDKKKVEASVKRILTSIDRAERMGADFVVVHAAYYGDYSEEEAFEKMKEITNKILEEMEKMKIEKTKLAYETMAKRSQFAGLEELLRLKEELDSKLFSICVDFAHLYVRNSGKITYSEILESLKNFDFIHSHFSNVKYNINTKKFLDEHIPINSHPPFEDLAKEILKRKVSIAIISESPKLELDSVKMKKVFESLGYKF